MASESHRVVIVGGGFGGLFAARRLRRGPVRGDAGGPPQPPPLPAAALSGRHRDPLGGRDRTADPKRAAAPAERRGRAGRGQRLRPGGSKADGHAPRRKPDRDPLRQPDRGRRRRPVLLRSRRVLALGAGNEDDQRRPRASRADPGRVRDGRARGRSRRSEQEWLTFVVVGGGPTGVEIAGQIAELSRRVLKDDFREIDPRNAKILLFDGGKEVLANFGDRLSGKAAKEPRAPRNRAAHVEHRHGHRSDRRGRQAGGRGAPDSGADEDLGRRSPGLPAGPDAGRGDRRQGGPRRAYQRAPRLHAARAPGGVRDRRHDVPRRAARRGRGGDAAGTPRLEHDQAPTAAGRRRSRSATGTSAAWRRSPGSAPWSASRASACPASSAGWRGCSSTWRS